MLVIPPGVETISVHAFEGVKISAILLPNTVKKIQRLSLEYTGLKDLFLPPGIEEVCPPGGTEIHSLHVPGSVKDLHACCWKHKPVDLRISMDDDYSPDRAGYYEVENMSISANQARFKYVNGLIYDKEEEELVCYNMDEQKDKVVVPRMDAFNRFGFFS